jgi:hypothetical protein
MGGKSNVGKEIGKVTDYFAHPVVAGVKMEAPLDVGDRVHFMGHTTDFELTVSSMQIDTTIFPTRRKTRTSVSRCRTGSGGRPGLQNILRKES